MVSTNSSRNFSGRADAAGLYLLADENLGISLYPAKALLKPVPAHWAPNPDVVLEVTGHALHRSLVDVVQHGCRDAMARADLEQEILGAMPGER